MAEFLEYIRAPLQGRPQTNRKLDSSIDWDRPGSVILEGQGCHPKATFCDVAGKLITLGEPIPLVRALKTIGGQVLATPLCTHIGKLCSVALRDSEGRALEGKLLAPTFSPIIWSKAPNGTDWFGDVVLAFYKTFLDVPGEPTKILYYLKSEGIWTEDKKRFEALASDIGIEPGYESGKKTKITLSNDKIGPLVKGQMRIRLQPPAGRGKGCTVHYEQGSIHWEGSVVTFTPAESFLATWRYPGFLPLQNCLRNSRLGCSACVSPELVDEADASTDETFLESLHKGRGPIHRL